MRHLSKLFIILLVIAFIARIIIAFYSFQYRENTDVLRYKDWGRIAYLYGSADTYKKDHLSFGTLANNQPPGSLYILQSTYYLQLQTAKLYQKLTNEAPGSNMWINGPLINLFLRFPSLIADLILGVFIYILVKERTSEKNALLASSFFLFNPVILYNSAFWGQMDSLNNVFMYISLFLLYKKRYFISILCFFLSLYIKLSLVFFIPLFFYFLYISLQKQPKKAIKHALKLPSLRNLTYGESRRSFLIHLIKKNDFKALHRELKSLEAKIAPPASYLTVEKFRKEGSKNIINQLKLIVEKIDQNKNNAFIFRIISATLVIIFFTFPLSSTPHTWLLEFITKNNLGEMEHITNFAFNFWWVVFKPYILLGSHDNLFSFSQIQLVNSPMTAEIFYGLHLMTWSIILFLSFLGIILFSIFKKNIKNVSIETIMLVFSAVAMIAFLFLPKMHERYMYPVFPLLASYIGLTGKHIWLCWALSLLNVINLYIVWHPMKIFFMPYSLISNEVFQYFISLFTVIMGIILFTLTIQTIQNENKK